MTAGEVHRLDVLEVGRCRGTVLEDPLPGTRGRVVLAFLCESCGVRHPVRRRPRAHLRVIRPSN